MVSNKNEIIMSVLNFLFFYNKILHAQKAQKEYKALKNIKKCQKAQQAQKRK